MNHDSAPRERRLILMRHAKSSWAEPGQADRERPLNRRGRLAASLMGAWLAELGQPIEAALVSDSRRTRETWERIAVMLPAPPAPEFRADIYEATAERLLTAARALPPDASAALMLGHSPGMEQLLALLTAAPRGQPLRMTTGAAAVLALTGAWSALGPGDARLLAFETPKTLV